MYENKNSDVTIITSVRFITLLVNAYNNRKLPVVGQFILIPNRINEFICVFKT
jgi:hypothetical protein